METHIFSQIFRKVPSTQHGKCKMTQPTHIPENHIRTQHGGRKMSRPTHIPESNKTQHGKCKTTHSTNIPENTIRLNTVNAGWHTSHTFRKVQKKLNTVVAKRHIFHTHSGKRNSLNTVNATWNQKETTSGAITSHPFCRPRFRKFNNKDNSRFSTSCM